MCIRDSLQEKIHAPGVFRWAHPVHEVLQRTDGRQAWDVRSDPGIVLEHHPDPKKSRAEYLPLLELSVREDPEDDRNAHYLGREYMFRGRWEDAIWQLKRHLDMPWATWKPERCASMRFLSLSLIHISISYKDNEGNTVFEEISRYDFLKQDEDGQFYWDDQFLFSCDTVSYTHLDVYKRQTSMCPQVSA